MKKKIYTKPLLKISFIDNEISLVMMTGEYIPPDKGTASQSSPQDTSPTQQNSFETNPFGE